MRKRRPFVFLDVSIDGDPNERLVFELFNDLVPKTAENFRALCTGEKGISAKTGKPLHYRGTFFHSIIKGSMAQGGDLLRRDGNFGESIYVERFPDERSKLLHDEPGLLSMAIADRDARGSLFSITFKANQDLDRKHVVFGKLIEGLDVLRKIESCGDKEGKPVVAVKITKCGEHADMRKASKMGNGKEASYEANNRISRRKMKYKRSSKDRRKRRRYYTSDSDSSSDTETETSDSDSESDSDLSSSSYSSSSSDDKRKKRKRSKRDRNRRGKKRDKRRKRRDKRSKRKSRRTLGGSSESESSTDDEKDRMYKNPAQVTGEVNSPLVGQRKDLSLCAEGQSDLVDHPGKNRKRSISPTRILSRTSISPKISLRKSLSLSPSRSMTPNRSKSVSRSVSGSPPPVTHGSRSFSRSPIRSGSSPARSVSSSPASPKRERSISQFSVRTRPRRSSSGSPTSSPPQGSRSRSPLKTSSRKSFRKLESISPIRSQSTSRSPTRLSRRSISQSSGRAPSRRSSSRSPIRESARNSRRSYSRSPFGHGRRARSPYAHRARSISRSRSPDGLSNQRTKQGRGFSQQYSNARRYHSSDRSPARSYRYGRSERDRYPSHRRSPRRYRTPPRERSPIRYRRSCSRSPIRYRRQRPSLTRSPVETTRYRASPRAERRISRRSRSRSLSQYSRSESSESPPAEKGLVSYGNGSPYSGER